MLIRTLGPCAHTVPPPPPHTHTKGLGQIALGLRFEQDRHSDDGICAVGRWDLVKIWGATDSENLGGNRFG